MNKKISINLAAAIAIICITVTFSVTMVLSMRIFDNTVTGVREKEAMYNKAAEIDKLVRADYIGEIDNETLYDMMSTGYMSGINDKYAVYYSAEQYATYLGVQKGDIVGTGLVLRRDAQSGNMRVVRIEAGSPAAGAELRTGILVSAVDGTAVKGLSAAAAAALMQGEPGTTVDVTVAEADGTEKTITLRRSQYSRVTTSYAYTEGEDTGYLRIFSFDKGTASEVDHAVRTMQKAGARALVIDVRDNENSNLDYACDVADLLCPTGVFAQVTDKNGKVTVRGNSDANAVKLPMVVLVNGGTSGAAEMFTAALQDLSGAKVVGTNTAGRWSVQCEPQRLSDGSAVVFTVGTLTGHNDETYEGVGIKPDILREYTPEEELNRYAVPDTEDPQVRRAFMVAASLITKNDAQNDTPSSEDTSGGDSSAPDASSVDAAQTGDSSVSGEDGSSSDSAAAA